MLFANVGVPKESRQVSSSRCAPSAWCSPGEFLVLSCKTKIKYLVNKISEKVTTSDISFVLGILYYHFFVTWGVYGGLEALDWKFMLEMILLMVFHYASRIMSERPAKLKGESLSVQYSK